MEAFGNSRPGHAVFRACARQFYADDSCELFSRNLIEKIVTLIKEVKCQTTSVEMVHHGGRMVSLRAVPCCDALFIFKFG